MCLLIATNTSLKHCYQCLQEKNSKYRTEIVTVMMKTNFEMNNTFILINFKYLVKIILMNSYFEYRFNIVFCICVNYLSCQIVYKFVMKRN